MLRLHGRVEAENLFGDVPRHVDLQLLGFSHPRWEVKDDVDHRRRQGCDVPAKPHDDHLESLVLSAEALNASLEDFIRHFFSSRPIARSGRAISRL